MRAPESPAWSRPMYFSPHLLHADPDVAALRHEWYAGTLAAMGEPSMVGLSRRPGRALRFLWLRQWHRPVAVRVSWVGELGVAEVTRLDGVAVPGRVGRLRDSWRVVLSPQDMDRLEDHLAAVDLWAAPSRDPLDEPDFDGARWVFEVVDDQRHHVVDRFSPEDPDLTGLGTLLLELGRVDVPEREIY